MLSLGILASCNVPIKNLDDNQIVIPQTVVEGEDGQIITVPQTIMIEGEEVEIVEEVDRGVVSYVNLNVRTAPIINSDNIVGVLSANESLSYLGNYKNEWYIALYNDEVVYLSANTKYTKVMNIEDLPENTVELDAEKIESIIEAGKAVLGVPYEYGSTRLLTYSKELNRYFTGDTYDCSAFVQYSYYIGAGIVLEGDSRSQSLHGEMGLSIDDLKRGDLIFMTSTSRYYNTGLSRIGHVAIYLGDNKMIHTYGTGGVRIDIFSNFWQDRFIHARRMI